MSYISNLFCIKKNTPSKKSQSTVLSKGSGIMQDSNNEVEAAKSESNNYIQKSLSPGKKVRILSIDGGGMRGIIPSMILQYIEEKTGKPIHESFDIISGTSTGGLLAGLLTLPKEKGSKEAKYTAKEATQQYLSMGPKIFKNQRPITQKLTNVVGLFSPQYSSENKRNAIEEIVEDINISESLTDLLITTFDVIEGVPYFFKSTSGQTNSKKDYKLLDALDATSSAPTYFSGCKVEGYDAKKEFKYRLFIDGGIVANNPTMCALSEILKVYNCEPKDVVILSLGCGEALYQEESDINSWGALQWASYIPSALMSSSMNAVNYQLEQVMKNSENYFRIQTVIKDKEHAQMDNVTKENLDWLQQYGKQIVEQEKASLDLLCSLL